MSLLCINEDRDYFADWSLPGSEKSISGQLRCTHERAELNLNDTFNPLRGAISVSDPIKVYPVVHGVSSKGEALSILHAQSLGTSLSLNSGGMRQSERLISSWVIVGAHVTADTLYASVRFFIPALEVWLGKPAISRTIELPSTSGKSINTFVVRPPDIETTPVPHIDATLEWGSGVTVSANPFASIDVTVQGWVVIRPQSPRTLEWFLKQQAKLATLMAFMAGKPMPVNAIQAKADQSAYELSVLVTLRQPEPCEFKDPRDFFVTRGLLGSTFQSIVEQWFREIDSVLVPSQLALGVLSTKNLWLHVEFLSLIQALEGFHRGRFGGNYMSDSEYDTVKSVIAAAIPTSLASDHRDALRSRIRYGNQISLRKRLNELRDCLGVPLATTIISNDGKIPGDWIDTRNYLSHWDEELRANSIDGQEMYNANVRMEHFLRSLYLLMAGIPAETLLNCLENSSRTSQQLVQLNIIARRALDPSAPSGVFMSVETTSVPQLSVTEEQTNQGDSRGKTPGSD